MATIGNWLKKRVQASGKKTAIVYNGRRFTYEEVNSRVNRLANGLKGLGVGKGDRVAFMLTNSIEMIEGLLACAKIGAIFLPINCRLSAAEVRYILSDGAPPKALIYCEHFSPLIDTVISHVPVQNLIQASKKAESGSYELFLAASHDGEPECSVEEEDIQLIMYTSGTTGFPKGAMLTHANIYWSMLQYLKSEPLYETDIALTVAPLFHIAAIIILTLPLYYTGGMIIIQDKFEPASIVRTIEQERVTCTFMVPCMWRDVMQLLIEEEHDLSSMRFGISAGAPCPPEVISFFNGEKVPLTQVLGMTESPLISMLKVKAAAGKNGSVGQPVVDFRVLGTDDRDVPQGGVGELVISGPGVIKGYWRRPEVTGQAMFEGWFRTGDLVTVDPEGYLYVVGRKKEMIITGGENVYPTEVEQVICQHPEIKEVAVIGVPDVRWGESVKAVAVLKDTARPLTLEALRSFCEGKLANYKIPKILELMTVLPRNPMGKLMKSALRDKSSTRSL